MSKIGNYIVGIQDDPCYEDGWKAASLGLPRDYVEDDQPLYAEQNAIWQAGWNAYHEQERSQ